MDVSELTAVLHARMAEQGSAERADGERRYLRSELIHLGVGLPVLRRITRQLLREQRLSLAERVALVEELWRQPIHELRQAGVEVLARSGEELDISHLDLVERLLRRSRTWALVDPLATAVAGTILRRDPAARTVLDRWIADTDFWVRRAALLAHLGPLRADPGPETFAAFAALADQVLDEPAVLDGGATEAPARVSPEAKSPGRGATEAPARVSPEAKSPGRGATEAPARVSPEAKFFVRKAIGWVLRETGKRQPALVTAWLAPRTHRASGVTMREAVKYLPAGDAERLMHAYRAGVPAT